MFDAAYFADPYPVWAQLRDKGPIHFQPGLGWLVMRHRDIKALARCLHMSSAQTLTARLRGLSPEVQEAAQPILAVASRSGLLLADPPDHTRRRAQAISAFTARNVEAWRSRIEAIANTLIDKVADAGRMDVIRDFAFPLPATVIMELLGIPAQDRDQLKAWSDTSIEFLSALGTSPDPLELTRRAADTNQVMREYFEALVCEKRARPAPDFLSALVSVQQTEDGRLNHEELLTQSIALLVAGHETTTNLIGNGLLALLKNPEQMGLLRATPDLARSAIEEFLRYDSPVQMLSRAATADFEIAGQTVRKAEVFSVVMAAANRDPEVFPNPDCLDVQREKNDHLSFGFDRHMCLGAQLARLEAQIAFRVLLERLPNLTLVSDAVEWHHNVGLRGLKRLHVRWS
jgi:pimeloyl-[acyl-carrier protein] synthase